MSRLHIIPRTLVIVLAMTALAAPMAAARPIDPAKTGGAVTPSSRVQDLRHLRAGGDLQTSSLAGTTSKARPGDLGPVYWSYDYAAQAPQARAVSVDDGTPWMTIGIAIAGMCLLIGAAAGLAVRFGPRSRRARVAA
jgi:hypothetical protein